MNEPAWLDAAFILDAHDQLIARYGGLSGVRDAALLESALAAVDLFLQSNGYELRAANSEVVRVIENLAAGIIDEATLTGWIEQHAQPL